ncbi:hypothetical protein EGI22_04345 [Lacihabitans sp. LS3-19]|uniref:VPS10 domain-containing protein n=1 Tax=Lacihabitans sp. LS3-19 TaxID=2487335 RepID=UPI0020CF73C3|nr:hypothetical protein [Lacihabitans sp. LS3-19]MCP9767128.1 hypothetical protein [Lacihabitans sp. LS3-19]
MKKFSIFSILISFTLNSFAQEALPIKGDEIFGSMRARHIGPALMSGRVVDLEGHPTDNKILYAGAAGGGVWKTADGGVTFNPIFDKHNQSIGAIKVDPKNPDQIIWVGTGEIWTRNSVTIGDGIYKTTDGGQNWNHMGLPKSERISSIKINPNNTDEVFVGVLGGLWSDSEDRGVYKTSDGGKTWNKIFYINASTGCSDLVMDPNDANIMYASFWQFRRTAYSFDSGGENSGLYKTTDGGKTWNKIHNGFPNGKLGRIAIALAPSNSKILYSVIESEKDEDKGLYRSDDAGANWTRTNGDFGLVVRPFYFSRIVVDPKNPDIVLKAGLNGSLSRDGGKTFKNIGGGIHADVHDFWFDLHDSNRIYLCDDGGVYRSYDGGSIWDMVKGIPVSQFYQVAIDNQTPYKVYGGLQDNGSWVGPSSKPGGIENRDWISVGAGDGFRTFPHPKDPNIVYSEMQGAENIWRINLEKNSAKTIKPFPEANDPKFRFNWNTPITTSPHNADRLYCGSQFLHKSDDRGETWVKISPDLTTNDPAKQQQENSGGLSMDNSGAENHCTIFAVNESPLDQNIIWVGTDDGNVQVTFDGGKNWNNVTANVPDLPKNTWCYFIEPSSFDKNTAYAVFTGYTSGDFKPYVYKTTDGGKTWKPIVSDDIKSFVRNIKEDYKNPNLLFLGTEGGLYVTIDGGQNWSPFKNNMPPVAVHWIALHPTEDALVMATHGRGVIIVDDISPLRQLTKEIIAKDLHFFTTKPTKMAESGSFGGYARMGEFVGENPSRQANIVYYLKSRHTFGKMSMEVFDKDNQKIADLPPGKSKGINYVDWNYSLKPPKVAKGKTIVSGGFQGPTVLPGTYKVKITKGNKTYENDLVLVADPKSIHTKEDRILQHETAMKLFAMNEELGYLVEQIDNHQTQLNAILPSLTSSKLKKQIPLAEISKNLETLKESLVVLKGDNYVGAAEPQLREKISGLFSEILGYTGRPTNAQLSSLKVLDEKLGEAKVKMEGLKSQISKLTPAMAKAKLPEIKPNRSFEEYKAAEN